MKRILSPILKSLAGTVVALLLLEIALRLLAPPPADLMNLSRVVESERGKFARYDSLLGWDGRPGVEADFQWIDTNHRVRQNRFGYRGSEYEQGPSDKRRVLVLGDSFVWGFGVEDDELFTSLVERDSGGRLEVVNAGVSGYGTDQDFLLWQSKGRLWEPDEVVLVITPYTDIVDNLFDKRYGYPKPRFVADGGGWTLTNVPVPETSAFASSQEEAEVEALGAWAGLLGKSHLGKMLVGAAAQNPGLRKKMEDGKLIPRRLPGYDWERPLYQARPSGQTLQAWEVMLGILEMFHRDVIATGSTFSVMIAPSIVQVYPDLWEQFGAGPDADPEAPNRIIGRWCADRGIGLVDPLADLQAAGLSDSYLYYPYNRHWTAAGHAIVAESLRQGLEPAEGP